MFVIRYRPGCFLADEASQTNLAVQVGETKADVEHVEAAVAEVVEAAEVMADSLKWTQQDINRMWEWLSKLDEKVNAHDVALQEILDVEVDEHTDTGDKSGAAEMQDAKETVASTAKTTLEAPEGGVKQKESRKEVIGLF